MSSKIAAIAFIAACLLVAFTSGKKTPEDVISDKCAKEYKLDKAAIDKFNKTRPIQTKDNNIKCYLKCLLVESKFMNAKGELTLPKFENNKEYAALSEACKKVNGTDPCDKAFNFHKCVMEKKEAGQQKKEPAQPKKEGAQPKKEGEHASKAH